MKDVIKDLIEIVKSFTWFDILVISPVLIFLILQAIDVIKHFFS